MRNWRLAVALGFGMLTCLSSFVIGAPEHTLEAAQTLLLWPGTPPGAHTVDDTLAALTESAIRDGTYIKTQV